MSDPSRGRSPWRWRRTPRLERLETRELLSALEPRTTSTAGITTVQQGPLGTPTAPAADAAGGLPTQGEVRRERFLGQFNGDYIIGPSRFTDQALALGSLSLGSTNQASRSSTQMRIVVPTNPSVAPTGQISILSAYTATTGSNLVLDLTGNPATDFKGVPSEYTWTVDSSSLGIYQQAVGNGTLELKYGPPRPGPDHGQIQGPLEIVIRGFVDVTGTYSNIGGYGYMSNQKL